MLQSNTTSTKHRCRDTTVRGACAYSRLASVLPLWNLAYSRLSGSTSMLATPQIALPTKSTNTTAAHKVIFGIIGVREGRRNKDEGAPYLIVRDLEVSQLRDIVGGQHSSRGNKVVVQHKNRHLLAGQISVHFVCLVAGGLRMQCQSRCVPRVNKAYI